MDDYIEIPGEFDFREPDCWGFNSSEHYKGQCNHHLREEAEAEAAALASEAEASQSAYDEWRSQ